MSKVYTDPSNYENIAEAIREQIGTSDTYKPSEMPDAIRSIAGGGGSSTAFCYAEAIRLANDTPYEVIAPIDKGLCVIEAIHRDTITVPSDWTLLYTTQGSSVSGGTYRQKVSIYYKHFEDPHITFTRTIADTTSLWPVNIHIFKDAGDPKVYKKEQLTAGQHISLMKATANAVIWSRHEIYWWSDSSNGWRTTEGWKPIYVEAGNGRLCTVVDYTYGQTIDIYPSATLGEWAGEFFAIAIPGAGVVEPVIEPLTATENGIYPAPLGVDGFAPVVVNVSGGGGEGNATIHWFSPKICKGDRQLAVHSDCELKLPVDAQYYTTTENILSFSAKDSLNLLLMLDYTNMEEEDEVSFSGIFAVYKYQNGAASPLELTVCPLLITDTYEPLTKVDNQTREVVSRMTVIRNNVKLDSGSDTASFTGTFPGVGIAAAAINSFLVYGDSYLKAGDFVININQRDSSSYYVWKEEGETEGLHFLKVRWRGASAYAGSIDQEWEVVFLSNGDVILRMIQKGTSSGNYNFKGKAYTVTTDMTVCFYRKDYYGLNWDIKNEEYTIDHHYPDATDLYRKALFSEKASTLTEGTVIIDNVAYDDNSFTFTFDRTFRWHSQANAVISGNSWIGIGGSSENIRMHRRDAKMWYLYCKYWELTDMDDLHALQITWKGASQYSGSTDRVWSLWLFENGDAMIYISTRGNNTGTCDFYGQTYTGNNNSFISFYYNPAAGNYTIQYELYTLEHHIQE